MAQQTAMQEAIEYLKSFNLEASAIILEDRFLEKEKEQIIRASIDTFNNTCEYYRNGAIDNDAVLFGEQYYNETYNK